MILTTPRGTVGVQRGPDGVHLAMMDALGHHAQITLTAVDVAVLMEALRSALEATTPAQGGR